MSQSLLTLVCSPALERPVRDWLLENEQLSGFTSMQAHGHGSNPRYYNLLEQVEGRKKQIIFQVHMPTVITEETITTFKEAFNGTDIHYWLLPVIETGCL